METRKLMVNKIMTLLLIFSLISSVQVFAQQRGNGPGNPGRNDHPKFRNDSIRGRGDGDCKGIPGLTKEQQDKIEKSKLNMERQIIPLDNQKGEKQAHLKTLNADDNADQTAIDKTIDEIAALDAKIAKLHNKHLQEVRSLLNNEQKVFFDKRPHAGPRDGKGPMPGPHHKKKFNRQVVPCPSSQGK